MLLVGDIPVLRCSSCKDLLSYQGTYLEMVLKDGVLVCQSCELAWHCEDGLPRLMAEDIGCGHSPWRERLQTWIPSLRDPLMRMGLPVLQLGGSERRLQRALVDRLELDSLSSSEPTRPVRLLEVGTSTGCNLPMLRDQLPGIPAELWATDHRPGLLSECRLLLGEQAMERSPTRVVMAAPHRLPFDDGTFDRVFEMGSLLGFDHASIVVTEMARVTRPGGLVVLVEPILSPEASSWQRQGFSLFALGDSGTTDLKAMAQGNVRDVRCEQLSPFYQMLSFRLS